MSRRAEAVERSSRPLSVSMIGTASTATMPSIITIVARTKYGAGPSSITPDRRAAGLYRLGRHDLRAALARSARAPAWMLASTKLTAALPPSRLDQREYEVSDQP